MTKDFKLIEHYLIPISLFMLNFAIVHFIFLNFYQQTFSITAILVLLCILFGTGGILKKNKVFMFSSSLLYLILLFTELLNIGV